MLRYFALLGVIAMSLWPIGAVADSDGSGFPDQFAQSLHRLEIICRQSPDQCANQTLALLTQIRDDETLSPDQKNARAAAIATRLVEVANEVEQTHYPALAAALHQVAETGFHGSTSETEFQKRAVARLASAFETGSALPDAIVGQLASPY